MRYRRPIAPVFLVVAIACAGGLALWRWQGAPASSDQRACFGLCWSPGQSQHYDLEMRSAVGSSSATPQVKMGLRGQLELQMLSHAPRLVRLLFTGEVLGVPDNVGTEAARAAFVTPQVFELDEVGAPVAVRSDTGVPAYVTQAWSALLWSMQVSAGPRGATTWQTLESDALGTYQAQYSRRAINTIHKQRLRYTEALIAGLAITIDNSQIVLGLDQDGHLERFTLAEEVHSSASGPLPSMAGRYQYNLVRSAKSRLVDLNELLASTGHLARSPVERARIADAEHTLDDARIQGRRFPDVMARLLAAEGSADGNDRALGREYIAMTALLRRDPQALALARQHLVEGGPLTLTLIAALRDAGSASAQALMVDMLAQPSLTPQQRLEIARALGRVDRPTAESIEALKAMRNESGFGQQARYGLGSAVFRLKDVEPALAQSVLRELMTELAETSEDGARIMDLIALGNAGHPDALDTIGRFVSHGSDLVRAAAAQALRRIPGGRAEAMLIAMIEDTSPKVRYSSVNAISEREPSAPLLAAIAARAVHEPEFQARAEAVRAAAAWLSSGSREVRASLEQVAQLDPNPDLRKIAVNALASAPTGARAPLEVETP